MQFCSFCGQRFVENAAGQRDRAPVLEPAATKNPPVTPKRSKMWLWLLLPAIGIVGFVGLASVVGVYLYSRSGGGKNVNVNTNSKPSGPRPVPAPAANLLYTESAEALIPAASVGVLAPGDVWKQSDIESTIKTYFPELIGSTKEMAGKDYVRPKPEEKISLWVLKFADSKTPKLKCETLKRSAEKETGRNYNESGYRILQTQMPAQPNAEGPPDTSADDPGCTAELRNTFHVVYVTKIITRRNLLIAVTGVEEQLNAINTFTDEYARWLQARSRSVTTPPTSPGEPSKAVVSAKEMFTAYKANAAAADQKYKGRNISVNGTITAAGTDPFGKHFALFDVGDSVNFVRCNFPDSAKSAVAGLKPNQPASLNGTVDGAMGGDVMLSNCSIAQ